MNQPHDIWGAYYDFVYEQTFGGYYHALTAETVNVIKQILPDATVSPPYFKQVKSRYFLI